MSYQTPPPLRCEIRRPPPELGWLKWSMAGLIVVGSMLDALWLVPAQRQAREARERAELTPVRCREVGVREVRVDGVWLGAPPPDAR